MIARRPMLLAGTLAAGLLVTGCGGSSAAPPKGVAHADAVSLLPTKADLNGLIVPTSPPNRYDQAISTTTLNPSFGSDTPRAMKLLSSAAEFDAVGPSGTSLYAHIYVFRTLTGAQSLTQTFLASNRLSGSVDMPSDAPGEQRQSSTQAYGSHNVSYRYGFREQNVLSYIELDGPKGKFSVGQATRIASVEDQRIRAVLK
jgi:hypothetical protein